jgi:Protein of unknown function (DUF3108)
MNSVAIQQPAQALRSTRPSLPKLVLLSLLVLLAHYAGLSGSLESFGAESGTGAASFHTRSIAVAPPAPSVLASTQAAPSTKAAAPRALPAPAKGKPKAAPARPKPAPETPAPAPVASPFVEPNQPLAGESTAQAATETIASTTPSMATITASAPSTETAASTASTASTNPPAYILGPLVIPAPQRLKYNITAQAKGLPFSASGDLQWRHDGNTYELRLQTSALFLGQRTDTSSGQLGTQGLEPQRYAYKSRSEVATHFERDKAQISFSANRPSASLQSGAQDRISVAMQLAAMFAGAPDKYPAGSSISIQVAGPNEAEPMVFRVEDDEQMDLPAGAGKVIKVSRAPRREFDRRVEYWLAPSLSYLPARIKITDPNGDFLDQVLTSVLNAAP